MRLRHAVGAAEPGVVASMVSLVTALMLIRLADRAKTGL
jgi:hypothetical protein